MFIFKNHIAKASSVNYVQIIPHKPILFTALYLLKVIYNIKKKNMGNILYTAAVILVIIWAIGFLGFHASGIIHILLAIAVIAILLRLIQGKKPV